MSRVTLSGLLIFFALLSQHAEAQLLGRISVPASSDYPAGTPLFIDLDQLTTESDSSLVFEEVTGGNRRLVPFQIEQGTSRLLWWILPENRRSGSAARVFELSKGKLVPGAQRKQTSIREAATNGGAAPVQVAADDHVVLITSQGKNVLQYNAGVVYPPPGVDTIFKRSGFIHPLWSPAGNALTRISPPDHYHHFGIWNPWTKVLFRGKTVDFWNLKERQGTVRFSRVIDQEEGAVYGRFRALQEHVLVNSAGEQGEVVMNEVWDVRVFNTGQGFRICDFTSLMNCATEDSVILKEYRYGGFGFRALEEWTNQNSTVLTSEGATRKEADAKAARWCLVEGQIGNGRSGILFMSHPTNYNFPEPTRVWPIDANGGRGDVFFSFSPTRDKDWPLAPGKTYALRYRMLIFDGKLTAEDAEAAWKAFAQRPGFRLEKAGN